MRNIFCAVFFLVFSMVVTAQPACSGKVVEAGTAKPVVAASVFISNSSAGTTTDDAGNFLLRKVPAGKFTLVVSSIGYETFVKQLETGKGAVQLTVELVHKTAALGEVIVSPAEKNGWMNWGDLFIEHFIGKSAYARECRIKNPKVLKFRNSVKDNMLKVWSDEPLVIENAALGYTISYDLREFTYNFSSNAVSYSGYPLFSAINSNDKKMDTRIQENRRRVYAVSLLHFLRCLYSNTTLEEGFRIVRTLNKTQVDLRKNLAITRPYDGVENYDTIYEISNSVTLVKIIPLQNGQTKNSNTTAADQASIGSIITQQEENRSLYFTDTLQVVYTKAKTPFEYQQYEENNKGMILSGISLVRRRPVTVFANGSYFESTNLSLSGFWAWWEKIAIMLPYDYEPEETPLAAVKTPGGN